MGLLSFIKWAWFWIDFGFFFEGLATLSVIFLWPFVGARKATSMTHKLVFRMYRPKMVYIGDDHKVIDDFRGAVISTHKGFFDFCILGIMGSSAFIGRMLAAFLVPFTAILLPWSGMYMVIRRGRFQQDPNVLVDRIKAFLASPRGNKKLMVFPEGHRHQQRGLLRVRTGFIRICFDNGIPVLVVPMEGSQYIINEKTFTIRRGLPLVMHVGGVVAPEDFGSWEDFYAEIKARFENGYQAACVEYDRLVGAGHAKKE